MLETEKRRKKKTHIGKDFTYILILKNIVLLFYLKESPPSAEFINVVNVDGGVIPPVLADADLEPSVPHDKFTV